MLYLLPLVLQYPTKKTNNKQKSKVSDWKRNDLTVKSKKRLTSPLYDLRWSMLAQSGIHICRRTSIKQKWCREEQHDTLQTGTIINHRLMTCWLENLKWQTLEERRTNARLTMLYKIKKNIEEDHKLIPTNRKLRNTNSNCFQIPSCNTTTRKESFYPRTIRD